MAVGYRSFLVVDGRESVVKPITKHIGAWIESIDIHLPTDQPGYHRLDDENEIIVQHETHRGNGVYRWRWNRPGVDRPGAVTRLSVTAAEQASGPGWLWIEAELPGPERAAWSARTLFAPVPPFVPPVLTEVACYDGQTPMTSVPMWASRDHVPDLMDYLSDEARRGPVFVASQDSRRTAEFQEWADDAMSDIIGLGVMFLLDKQVEQEFNEMVGERHAIGAGAVRTYLPGVNLDRYHDENRHPVLSVSRIDRTTGREVSHLLGAAQRSRLSRLPVPPDAVEVDRILQEREDQAREHADRATGGRPPTPAAASEQTERARIQAVQIAELRLANAHLRADMDVLTDRLAHFERCQEGIMRALRDAQRGLMATGAGHEPADRRDSGQRQANGYSAPALQYRVDQNPADDSRTHDMHQPIEPREPHDHGYGPQDHQDQDEQPQGHGGAGPAGE
ncbi:hypothetical protein [Phytoactinopolyspora halotolerans]|uniref:Uncharacterized protein n=1 Tax=Phytoactinopolyspora halotolerans TaxID=1981512 RepID=A0A6L9S725_9ACTN|nr:hypothetical protein [Phytoactinopolyspora halotolerans]NEE00372.1 hypothetical protein [Phytoactinopolyspora halotolerans]